MRKTRIVSIAATMSLAMVLAAQTKIRHMPIQQTSMRNGAEMYDAYCASCHGTDGKGAGPAAKALKIPPTDLTTLAKFNAGEFPALSVLNTLTGAKGTHGEAMPVWGEVFRVSGQHNTEVQLRMYNLTHYLESIQEPSEKPEKPAKPEKTHAPKPLNVSEVSRGSGAEMYRSLCASCHGFDGRGGGPSAASLKLPASDLTLLSKNNSGKFPALHVHETLGPRPGAEAHGSKEMPVWGNVFRAGHEDQAVVEMRIANLVRYLEGIQR